MTGCFSEYCVYITVSMSKLRTSPAVTPRACLHPLSVVQYSIDLCSRSDFCTLVFYFAVYVLFIARRRFSWWLNMYRDGDLVSCVVIHHNFTLLYFTLIFTSIVNVQCLLSVLVLFNVCIVNCIILLFSGEVV